MPALARHDLRITAAEFERMARSGGFGDARFELREGEIVKMSPLYTRHAYVSRVMTRALDEAVQQADVNWIVLGEVSLALGDFFQPLPDIAVVEIGDPLNEPSGPVPAEAVRLAVEVAETTLADDLGEKLASYARAGVMEYWVADIAKRRMLLHAEPDGDTYARREPRIFGERFPALTLPLLIDTVLLAPAS